MVTPFNTQAQGSARREEFLFTHLKKVHPAAAELLCVCALLAPVDIPEEFFLQEVSLFGYFLQAQAQEVGSPRLALDQTVEVLLAYKLMECGEAERTLHVDASVQSIVRKALPLEERQQSGEQALRVLHHIISSFNDIGFERLQLFVPHVQQMATLSESWTLSFPEAAEIFSWVAKLLCGQELYQDAEQLLKRALTIYEYIHGNTHSTVATALYDLANVYKAQRNYIEAQNLFIKAHLIRMQILGEEHPDRIHILYDMGYVYAVQGKREEAETLYKRALTNSELVLGHEHPFTVMVLDSLASLYVEWMNTVDAEAVVEEDKTSQAGTLSQRINNLRRRIVGPSQIDTAQVLHKLALVYMAQEKWEQAEIAYQRVLSIYERVLGSTHPNTMQCLDQLAVLYLQQQRIDEAEATLQQVLQMREQTLGLKHPDVAASLNSLGQIYIAQERFEQAEPLVERALAIYVDALEETPIGLVISLNNLVAVYSGLGLQQRAMPFLQQVYVLLEQALGPEHPDVIAVREQYQQLIGLS